MLAFDRVSYSYHTGSGATRAVDAVSFTVQPGEVLAVLGANGSGKSTLALLANGLALPDEGRVHVDGYDTADASSTRAVRTRAGIVFQRPEDQIVATTVADDVAFGPENLGLERGEIETRVAEALAAVGLSAFAEREPHMLSGGQKQRLALAGALAMRPRYLVLDEPTSMLDPLGRAEVHECVRRLRRDGISVLLVTHDLTEALLADSVLVLDRGSVVFTGTVAELVTHPELDHWGLERPAVLELASALESHGVDVGPAASVGELVEALCR